MVKLPDPSALGGVSVPGVQRGIAVERAPGAAQRAAARASMQAAAGFERLGQNVTSAITSELDARDRQEFAYAKSAFYAAKVAADNAFDQDQDYATFSERYNKQITNAAQDAEQMITSDRTREFFRSSINGDIALGKERMKDLAFRKEADYSVASLNDLLTTNRENALNAKNPEDRAGFIQATNDAINAARDRGYLTAEQAQKTGQKWTQNYSEAFIGLQTADDQLRILGQPGIADFIPEDRRALLVDAATQTKVREAIRVDPDQAVVDLLGGGYEGLNDKSREIWADRAIAESERLDRKALSDEARAERQSAKALKLLEDNTAKEGYALLREDKLTPEWVESNRERMSLSSYKDLLKASSGGSEFDNPDTIIEIYTAMGNGENVEATAVSAYANNKLKLGTLNTILSRNDTVQSTAAPGTAFERANAYLDRAIRPTQGFQNPEAQAAAYANAKEDLLRYFDENPNAKNDVGKAVSYAKSLADAYRVVPVDNPLALPYPAWMPGSRNDRRLDDAETMIKNDLESGEIDIKEAARRAETVNRWRDYEQMGAQ